MIYPACTPASCVGNATFTTCDAGSSGSNVFASCPLTMRLAAQLQADVTGVVSAPDPLGGGQDPEWTNETFTSAPSSTGGVVHVVLRSGPSAVTEKIDLAVVLMGTQLLVDDLYCTGSDPSSSDVFASGWLIRSVCSS